MQASLERATHAAAQLFGCPGLRISGAEERTDRRKAKSVWGREKLFEVGRYLRDWQERKDAATIIVENGRIGRVRRGRGGGGNHPIHSLEAGVWGNSKAA